MLDIRGQVEILEGLMLGARVGPIPLPTFANLINGENTKAVEQEGRSEWCFYIQLQTIIEA